jgi:hypothetical protein
MALGHHVLLVSDRGLTGRIAHQKDMMSNMPRRRDAVTPKGSKRSGEAASWPADDRYAIALT